MDDPYAHVPGPNPTANGDHLSTRQILMGNNEGSYLGFDQFPEVPGPSSSNAKNNSNAALFPQQSEGVVVGDGGEFWDPNNYDAPLDLDMLYLINDSSDNENEHFVAAGSSVPNGERIKGGGNIHDIPQSTVGFGNPIQLSLWPVPPSPYACSCCHILREIIHTNGPHITNLEIHGRVGMITHAILDKYDFDISTKNHVYLMYDFCKESLASVKNFLLQYCEYQKWEGYKMERDPLSIYYEALCVGIDVTQNLNPCFQPDPMASGNDPLTQQEDIGSQQNAEIGGSRLQARDRHQENPEPQGESGNGGRAKSSLATQRERTGKMKLKDFTEYFDLPINDAAKQMGVCSTVIKKKCREAGLPRWPYRKIKGIKRKISLKQQSLLSVTAEERPLALAEIQMLEQELADIFQQLTNDD